MDDGLLHIAFTMITGNISIVIISLFLIITLSLREAFIFHMNMTGNFCGSWITLYCFHYGPWKRQCSNRFRLPQCLISTQFEGSISFNFSLEHDCKL